MILDNYLNNNNKLFIAMISSALWIYFRTESCYSLLPNYNFLSIILVVVWIYLYSLDYLFLPIGLLSMYLFSLYHKRKLKK